MLKQLIFSCSMLWACGIACGQWTQEQCQGPKSSTATIVDMNGDGIEEFAMPSATGISFQFLNTDGSLKDVVFYENTSSRELSVYAQYFQLDQLDDDSYKEVIHHNSESIGIYDILPDSSLSLSVELSIPDEIEQVRVCDNSNGYVSLYVQTDDMELIVYDIYGAAEIVEYPDGIIIEGNDFAFLDIDGDALNDVVYGTPMTYRLRQADNTFSNPVIFDDREFDSVPRKPTVVDLQNDGDLDLFWTTLYCYYSDQFEGCWGYTLKTWVILNEEETEFTIHEFASGHHHNEYFNIPSYNPSLTDVDSDGLVEVLINGGSTKGIYECQQSDEIEIKEIIGDVKDHRPIQLGNSTTTLYPGAHSFSDSPHTQTLSVVDDIVQANDSIVPCYDRLRRLNYLNVNGEDQFFFVWQDGGLSMGKSIYPGIEIDTTLHSKIAGADAAKLYSGEEILAGLDAESSEIIIWRLIGSTWTISESIPVANFESLEFISLEQIDDKDVLFLKYENQNGTDKVSYSIRSENLFGPMISIPYSSMNSTYSKDLDGDGQMEMFLAFSSDNIKFFSLENDTTLSLGETFEIDEFEGFLDVHQNGTQQLITQAGEGIAGSAYWTYQNGNLEGPTFLSRVTTRLVLDFDHDGLKDLVGSSWSKNLGGGNFGPVSEIGQWFSPSTSQGQQGFVNDDETLDFFQPSPYVSPYMWLSNPGSMKSFTGKILLDLNDNGLMDEEDSIANQCGVSKISDSEAHLFHDVLSGEFYGEFEKETTIRIRNFTPGWEFDHTLQLDTLLSDSALQNLTILIPPDSSQSIGSCMIHPMEWSYSGTNSYHLEMTNTSAEESNCEARLLLPSYCELISSSAGFVQNGDTVIFSPITLPPSQSDSIQVEVLMLPDAQEMRTKLKLEGHFENSDLSHNTQDYLRLNELDARGNTTWSEVAGAGENSAWVAVEHNLTDFVFYLEELDSTAAGYRMELDFHTWNGTMDLVFENFGCPIASMLRSDRSLIFTVLPEDIENWSQAYVRLRVRGFEETGTYYDFSVSTFHGEVNSTDWLNVKHGGCDAIRLPQIYSTTQFGACPEEGLEWFPYLSGYETNYTDYLELVDEWHWTVDGVPQSHNDSLIISGLDYGYHEIGLQVTEGYCIVNKTDEVPFVAPSADLIPADTLIGCLGEYLNPGLEIAINANVSFEGEYVSSSSYLGFRVGGEGYHVYESDDECHLILDSVYVVANNTLPLPNNSLCVGNELWIQNPNPGFEWTIDGVSTLADSVLVTTTGEHSYEGTYYDCPIVTQIFTIEETAPLNYEIQNDNLYSLILCQGDSIQLSFEEYLEEVQWHSEEQALGISLEQTINEPGLYFAEYSNGCHLGTDSIYVESDYTGDFHIYADSVLCAEGHSILTTNLGETPVFWLAEGSGYSPGGAITIGHGGWYAATPNQCFTIVDSIYIHEDEIILPQIEFTDSFLAFDQYDESWIIQWYIDDQLIEAGNNWFIDPLNAGVYSASIETHLGCEYTTDSFEFYPNNIVETNAEGLKVFPNPTSGLFNISMPSNYDKSKLVMTNSAGQVVYEALLFESETTVDVQDLAKGLYFLNFYNETGLFESLRLSIID